MENQAPCTFLFFSFEKKEAPYVLTGPSGGLASLVCAVNECFTMLNHNIQCKKNVVLIFACV